MNITRTFHTRESEQGARDLIGHYLEQVGYKQAATQPFLVYKRGGRLGSAFAPTTKQWRVEATVQTTPCPDQTTQVDAVLEVDTTGQMVLKREQRFFEQEMDGLVAAAGGTLSAPGAEGASGGLTTTGRTIAGVEDRPALVRQLRSGSSWFFFIGGMSLVNSILQLANANVSFLVGLGITQVVDALALVFGEAMGAPAATVLRVVALVVNVAIAGLFVLFGVQGRKGHLKVYTLGMILYGLDALIFLIGPELLSIGFHLLALVFLFVGLRAGRKLKELEKRDVDAMLQGLELPGGPVL